MTGRRATLALAALALMGAACAHRPATPAAAEAPAWPAPPAAPRVRLLADVRIGAATRAPASWWRGAVSWLTGVDAAAPDEGLIRPFDAAFAPDGTILVADPDGPRVLRFAAGGAYLADLSCAGRAWRAPVSVAASGDEVFVSDPGGAVVVLWSATGCRPLGEGALERPAGLAVSADQVLVADPPAHRVVALRRDGTVAARWGAQGSGDGQLHFPSDVALGPDGSVFVVDTFNFRVAHLAADGRWLGAFGAPGEAEGGFARPKGIAAGPDGTLWISDADRDLVLAFDAAGAFQLAVGSPGPAPGAFSHPAGLAATRDRLAVADSLNRRIQVFEILGERP
jgi:glucose/arabinose dehydrogenase